MIRRLLLLVAALAVLAVTAGTGAATAAPVPGSPTTIDEPQQSLAQTTAANLPEHFPADLRQFVGGTDEFKAGPWFTGDCKDHGGDLGLYISNALTVENRLLYWTASDEQKTAMIAAGSIAGVGSPSTPAAIEGARAVAAGGSEPAPNQLPPVFPAGDAAFHPPTGTCAEDLGRWSTKQWSTWGFQWAAAPDTDSLTAIRALPGADKVPAQAFSDPCKQNSPAQYCMHAFFVDCTKAAADRDARDCQNWNLSIGRLFAGTANWLDENTSLTDRLGDTLTTLIEATPQYKVGNAYVQAFSWIAGKTGDLIDFVKDPTSVIDDWANAAKKGGVPLSTSVLRGLSEQGDFDITDPGYLRWYAFSTGVGIVVMAFATLFSITRSRSKGSPKELVTNLFGYLPAGVVASMFAPALAQMLMQLFSELSKSVVSLGGSTIDETVGNISATMSAMNSETVVGGSIVGLMCFVMLLLGSLSVYIGLKMHEIGLPLAGVVAGVGFGMWVHPTWRVKALRPVLTFVGLLASKPLLFLLIVVTMATANSSLSRSDDLASFGTLVTLGTAMVVVGLAPWALLKWGPILPTRSDSEGFGSGGGSVAGGVVGGLGSSALFHRRSSGGGGGLGRLQTRPNPGKGQQRPSVPGAAGSQPGGGQQHTRTPDQHAGNAGSPRSRRSSSGAGVGMAARLSGRLAAGAAGGVITAGAIAVPIAAQSAAAAMNKAKSGAEAAPTEADRN